MGVCVCLPRFFFLSKEKKGKEENEGDEKILDEKNTTQRQQA
jgi:hypothetical protein